MKKLIIEDTNLIRILHNLIYKYTYTGKIIVRNIKKKLLRWKTKAEKFPKLKKWINECNCCHCKGYVPDMPDKITEVDGSLEVFYIKKYFKPLFINKDGKCETCEKVLLKKHK